MTSFASDTQGMFITYPNMPRQEVNNTILNILYLEIKLEFKAKTEVAPEYIAHNWELWTQM